MPDVRNTLKRLHVKNLTVFSEAAFDFSSSLNMIVGANGTGKTHVLKAAYSIVYTCANAGNVIDETKPTKAYLQRELASKLVGVFKPDQLGRLIRRKPGRNRCEIAAKFSSLRSIAFSFNSTSKREVSLDRLPVRWVEKLPVYLPTRELLTIAPGFVSLYETTRLQFSEVYRDTCVLLEAPLARGPREGRIKELLEPIEQAMGGRVESDETGRFYLRTPSGRLEMQLVAEGHRKLAMLARLIATGQLIDRGFLFWDEPEANLNPQVIKQVARTILHLCGNGIQVFVATHSLFLMREIDILLRTEDFQDTPSRFFGLHPSEDGIEVAQGDSIDEIGEIPSLQEELTQSDRYLEVGE